MTARDISADNQVSSLRSFLSPRAIFSLSGDIVNTALGRKLEDGNSLERLNASASAELTHLKNIFISRFPEYTTFDTLKNQQTSIETLLFDLETQFQGMQEQLLRENQELREELSRKNDRIEKLSEELTTRDREYNEGSNASVTESLSNSRSLDIENKSPKSRRRYRLLRTFSKRKASTLDSLNTT